jgi:HAD superfamily hydrolase (TIGR01509 family)
MGIIINNYLNYIQESNKPIRMYRSGPVQNIKVFLPRTPVKSHSKTFKNKIKDLVYATDDISFAAGFCFYWSNEEGFKYGRNNNGPLTLEVPEKYKNRLSQKCSMYEVNNNTFKKMINNYAEYYSEEPVKVIKEIKFKNCYECLKKYKVQVKFNRLNKSQQITTIAFDLGGVLITEIDYPLSKEEDIIERKVFSINNQEDAYKKAMQLTGLDIINVKKAFKNICQNLYTLREPKIFKSIPKLKFAIASNAPKEMHEWINKTKLPKFDFILISCDIGIGKPDRKFYEILVNGLKEDPSNILFIDDRKENILAAKKFGLQTIQYNRNKPLSVIINQYLKG